MNNKILEATRWAENENTEVGTTLETEVENEALELVFEPKSFVDNIGYMGAGMLGIFIVIGLIICTTSLLNFFTGARASKKKG